MSRKLKMLGKASRPDARAFKAHLYVSRSYEDATGAWWLEGVASGTAVDSYGERMSDGCVSDFSEQINSGQLRVLTSHWSDWEGQLGYAKEGSVEDGELRVKIWLDKEHPDAKKLWRAVQGVPEQGIAPVKLGMSIGGWIIEASHEILDSQSVFTMEKLELDHIAITSMPAYPNAWIESVTVKTREFARPWLRDIVRTSGLDRTPASAVAKGSVALAEVEIDERDEELVAIVRSLTDGGATVEDEEDLDATKSEDDEDDELDAEKSEDADADPAAAAKGVTADDLLTMFDAIKAQMDEGLGALKSALPKVRLVKASELIDEEVLVRDEDADAEEEEDEDLDDEADDADDDEESEKSEEGDKLTVKTSAGKAKLIERLKSERAARKALEARIAKLEGKQAPVVKSAGAPLRKGLRNTDDDKGTEDHRMKGTENPKVNWVEALKATKAYQDASPPARVQMVREGMAAELKKSKSKAA